jgi:cytochrome c biogenesis protein CcdA
MHIRSRARALATLVVVGLLVSGPAAGWAQADPAGGLRDAIGVVPVRVGSSYAAVAAEATSPDAAGSAELIVFHSESCPHCRAELAFLDDLSERHPTLDVRAFEVGSPANRDLLARTARQLGFEATGVPVTIFQKQVWVGFGPQVEADLERLVAAATAPRSNEPSPALDATPADGAPAPDGEDTTLAVPLVGDVDMGDQSLLVATVLIGFLDGVNPCSLWVLSLLLALVVHTGSRRRVFLVGAVFLVITTALYGLYMAGVYSVLAVLAYVTWIRVGVAVVAGGLGAVNLLDALGVDLPMRLRIPEARKPGIYRRMRSAARSQRSLPATVGATAALAVGVSLVETPCTAGFPIVWGNLLTTQGVDGAGAALLFAVYMLVFLLDELAVFTIAVVTLRASRLQAEQGTLLKLAGGVVMLTLAVVMVAFPRVLESVAGTAAVFGSAAVITLVASRWLRHRNAGGAPPPDHRAGRTADPPAATR